MTRVLLTIEQKRLNRISCNAKYRAANKEKIREIDLQIAELLKEKENLMMNIGSGQTTFGQSIDRSPNE